MDRSSLDPRPNRDCQDESKIYLLDSACEEAAIDRRAASPTLKGRPFFLSIALCIFALLSLVTVYLSCILLGGHVLQGNNDDVFTPPTANLDDAERYCPKSSLGFSCTSNSKGIQLDYQ